MAKRRLDVVLVGAGGNMRGAHVPRILADKSTKIVGVADPEEDHAKQLQERAGYEIPYFANWQAMLKNVESDGGDHQHASQAPQSTGETEPRRRSTRLS